MSIFNEYSIGTSSEHLQVVASLSILLFFFKLDICNCKKYVILVLKTIYTLNVKRIWEIEI